MDGKDDFHGEVANDVGFFGLWFMEDDWRVQVDCLLVNISVRDCRAANTVLAERRYKDAPRDFVRLVRRDFRQEAAEFGDGVELAYCRELRSERSQVPQAELQGFDRDENLVGRSHSHLRLSPASIAL
jgi:hypothetical protein